MPHPSPLLNPSAAELEYSQLSHPPFWIRFLLSPIGWPFFTSCGLVAAVVLYSFTPPGGYPTPALMCIPFTLVLIGPYALRFIIRLVLVLSYKDPTNRVWRQGWRWLIPPAMLFLLIVAIFLNIPLHVGFYLSKYEMDTLVRDVNAAGAPVPDRRVGIYRATKITLLPGGAVIFTIPSTGDAQVPEDFDGFIYIPPCSPPLPAAFTPKHIAGNWYTF